MKKSTSWPLKGGIFTETVSNILTSLAITSPTAISRMSPGFQRCPGSVFSIFQSLTTQQRCHANLCSVELKVTEEFTEKNWIFFSCPVHTISSVQIILNLELHKKNCFIFNSKESRGFTVGLVGGFSELYNTWRAPIMYYLLHNLTEM